MRHRTRRIAPRFPEPRARYEPGTAQRRSRVLPLSPCSPAKVREHRLTGNCAGYHAPMDLADIDKAALMDAILREINAAVERSTAMAKRSAESAVHEESRAEDSKDTRAIEESYLARGQASRAAELEVDRAMLKALAVQDFRAGRPIAASALVEIVDDGGVARTLLLVPRAGGRNFHFGGREITLATPSSPLGGALLGAVEGDDVEVIIRGRTRVYEIVGAV